MKLLLDFLPILLFFLTFKWAEGQPAVAAAWATDHLGGLVAGGIVSPAIAPVLLATVVVVAATLAQVGYLMARRQKIEPMLWVSLGLVVVLGGATVWLQSEAFIKWKPTLLYGAMGGSLLLARWIWRRNLLRALLGSQLTLPEAIWWRLNTAWALFFVVMGALNLWVAYAFETATWVNFKLFGGMGLMVVFVLGQAMYLARYMKQDPE